MLIKSFARYTSLACHLLSLSVWRTSVQVFLAFRVSIPALYKNTCYSLPFFSYCISKWSQRFCHRLFFPRFTSLSQPPTAADIFCEHTAEQTEVGDNRKANWRPSPPPPLPEIQYPSFTPSSSTEYCCSLPSQTWQYPLWIPQTFPS